MRKRDVLRQEMKKQGIVDPRIERGRRVNLFVLLRSLGVDNPKQTLTRFVHDEIKTSETVQQAIQTSTTGTLSLGPWSDDGVLGFVNRTGHAIKLSGETARGFADIEWRRLEGVNKTLPITIPNGGIYEVYVTNLQSNNFSDSNRFYLSYRVDKA